MNNHTFECKISSSDLASRHSAAAQRRVLLKALEVHQKVRIDMSLVKSISDSYADELFGVLASEIGLECVLSRVKIVGANEGVLKGVARNIKNRVAVEIAA
jgi:hypothetical protein